MYLGELGQCISVAYLWWDADKSQRLALLKRRDADGWAVYRYKLGEMGLPDGLQSDWFSVWVGDWADFRARSIEVWQVILMEDLIDANSTDIQTRQFGGDNSTDVPVGGDGS